MISPAHRHPVSLHEYSSAALLDERLARRVAAALRDAVAHRKTASLVVSGGRTPAGLLQRLSECDLPWQQIYVTLADERWVDATAPESNEAMVKRTLLQNYASDACWIGLKTPDADPATGLEEATRRLAAIRQPLNVVLLGMGSDGHTASLFPDWVQGNSQLLETEAPVAAVHTEASPVPRMTLLPRYLLNSSELYIHITGPEKLRVIERAMQPGPLWDLPIRCILHSGKPVHIFWSASG